MNGIVGTIGPSGRRDFFYLDNSFQMKQRTWSGVDWGNDWLELGGVFKTAPAVVSTMAHKPLVVSPGIRTTAHGPTPMPANAPAGTAARRPPIDLEPLEQRIDVFGLGLDSAMYHKTLWGTAASHPGRWTSLGGVFRSAPAAIWLDGQLHVFALGADLSMYWRMWNGSAWSGDWQRIGGYFSSAPVLASWEPGRLDVFARGADYSLRHRLFERGVWAGDWQNLGGSLASAPASVTWGQDRLDVFAIANNDAGLIHRWWDGSIWNDWEHVAGTSVGDTDVAFTSAPAAATWGEGRIDLFAVDSHGRLRHVWYDNHTWSDPEPLVSGTLADTLMRSTPMVLVTEPGQLDVITPGRDHNLYRKFWNGSAWDPPGWSQLGDHMRLPSQFRISIDLIRCNTPRSLNNDTVTGQCTLKVGNWPNDVGVPSWPLLPITQKQGDLGNTAVDTSQPNRMHFDPVTIELHESAAFHYTFVNSNAPDPEVVAALKAQALKLVDDTVKSVINAAISGVGLSKVQVGALAAPITGTLLGILTGWLIGELNAIIKDACDGPVAAENYVRAGGELQAGTMNVVHKGQAPAPPLRCGAASEYVVRWSISASRM